MNSFGKVNSFGPKVKLLFDSNHDTARTPSPHNGFVLLKVVLYIFLFDHAYEMGPTCVVKMSTWAKAIIYCCCCGHNYGMIISYDNKMYLHFHPYLNVFHSVTS